MAILSKAGFTSATWVDGKITLSGPLPEEPAKEFRLFRAGVNRTSKGDFLFDDAAAAAVMAAFTAQANDLMIDLDHMSLREPAQAAREDAGDARGWAKLALRDGELWAVDVRWTPDGESRVRSKKQRYPSPAFTTDEQGRITEILNIALVAMPATYGAAPLIAASRNSPMGGVRDGYTRGVAHKRPHEATRMDPELVKKALELIASGDEKGALELLKQAVASAAGGGGADPAAAAALADPAAPGAEPKPDPELAALTALSRELVSLSGRSTPGEAASFFRDLVTNATAANARHAALELSERRGLVARLVACGAETPATAFKVGTDGVVPEGDAAELSARLASEPIAELRARVPVIEAARGVTSQAAPPVGKPRVTGTLRKLSRAEEDFCKRHNLTREQFEARKSEAARSS